MQIRHECLAAFSEQCISFWKFFYRRESHCLCLRVLAPCKLLNFCSIRLCFRFKIIKAGSDRCPIHILIRQCKCCAVMILLIITHIGQMAECCYLYVTSFCIIPEHCIRHIGRYLFTVAVLLAYIYIRRTCISCRFYFCIYILWF